LGCHATGNRMMPLLKFFIHAGSSRAQREQALENFRNLRRQIPLLYAAALVNLIGLHVATSGQELTLFSPVTLLTGLLLWRMVVWVFFRRDSDDYEVVASELVKMVAFTMLLCLGFSIWAQLLISAHPDAMMSIFLFNILAALGAAYGLSSFPRAAMLPVAILGLPMAGRLMFLDSPTTTGIGISLLLVLLLLMRLLHTHSRALAELVESRLAAAQERHRAIAAEIEALKKADLDALTGLANRGKLLREIGEKMFQGPISGGGSVLAMIDLDGFKAANDVFGHAAGDAILKAFAERLSVTFGEQAVVARTGGDEFTMFWPMGLSRQDIEHAGETICNLASALIEWEGKQLHVSASCGLTEAGPLSRSVSEFLRQADSALYCAKAAGKSAWQFYDHTLLSADRRRAGLETLLLDGQGRNDLTVVFQPIVCLNSNKIAYAEALARWDSQQLGHVSPSEFIHVAEQLGTISQLNDTLLRKATALARIWPLDFGVAFNLSALQISHEGAASRLLHLLAEEGFSPSRMQFEVTETAFATDLATVKRELQTLRQAGSIIALDDFGAGHASVSYLRDLVFDVIKLDGSLTTDIEHCERSRRILLGLINLCHATGAKCVAEHIETEEQLTLIRAMGCDFAQGYFLAPPAAGMPKYAHEGADKPRHLQAIGTN
jgi:diguanylate cyclase (GGDEF)-like protein